MKRSNTTLRFALLAGTAISLAACSYIGELFPDKQKQYRYSSELPDLEIPPDLDSASTDSKDEDTSSKSKRDSLASSSAGRDSGNSSSRAKTGKDDTSSSSPTKKRKPVAKHSDASVTLAENMQNVALIEMQEPYAEAWNDVGRALGRLKIEISDQNRSDGVYYVYYGGESPKKKEETTLWEDIGSFFSAEKDKAQEYRVKLADKEEYTFVTVLDQGGDAVSAGPGLELLKRLHKKLINLDKPDTEAEDGKKPPEEPEKK